MLDFLVNPGEQWKEFIRDRLLELGSELVR
jgi:hypothetical protein